MQEQKCPWLYEKGGSPRAGWGEAGRAFPNPSVCLVDVELLGCESQTSLETKSRQAFRAGSPQILLGASPDTRGQRRAQTAGPAGSPGLEGHCLGRAGASLCGCSRARDAMLFQNSSLKTAWRVFFTPSRVSLLVRPFGRVLARHSFRPVTAERRHCGWAGPRQWPDHSLSQLNLGLLGSPANTVADYQRPRLRCPYPTVSLTTESAQGGGGGCWVRGANLQCGQAGAGW